MRRFILPTGISLGALAAVYLWGGIGALLLAAALAILEVTLSFDNAMVNANVLTRMSPLWQRRFLTWGMLISVFGIRLVLPILIVGAVAFISPVTIAILAFADPSRYATLIASTAPVIKAFGGTFLLLVALSYFFDGAKRVHWLKRVEQRLVSLGTVGSLEVALSLAVLLGIAAFAGGGSLAIIKSGIVGIVLYILMRGIREVLGAESAFARAGLALFMYVSVLDAALSLDGVIGAFALTSAVPIIVVGLGIGAYFVRTLTIAMVEGRTLERFIYLEHGAHWAIFGLAACMLAGLVVPVPEWFTAGIGLFFIALAYGSSRREEVYLAS